MKKQLTDVFLRTLKAPSTGRTEIADTAVRGLTYRLSASGAKAWSFRFRDPASGRVTRQTFDGSLALKAARELALEARSKVARGLNPVEEKRRDRREAQTRTFDALATRYLKEHAYRHKRSGEADARMLRSHVRPKWDSRRYDRITRADVIELCEELVTAGKPIMANRVQALISKVFSYALDHSLVTSHPSMRLRKRTKEIASTRTLTDGEIRLFWSNIGQAPNSARIELALKLALLTGARVGEVAGAQLAEFDHLDDPAKAAWTVPTARSKNGKAHLVPLSDMARAIVLELVGLRPATPPARAGRTTSSPASASRFLLPSPIQGTAIAGHALSVAMLRFGASMAQPQNDRDQDAVDTWRADRPSAHDLRRTLATRLAEAGVSAEDVSACLNHVRRGVTAVHYDHYDRAREKRRALSLWSTLLSTILTDDQSRKVVPLRIAGAST